MKKQFSWLAYAKTEEGKKQLHKINQQFNAFIEPQLKALHKIESEINDTCSVVYPIIIKDFEIDPRSKEVFEFFIEEYDHVMPETLLQEINMDEFIRRYAKWRKVKHYNHLKWRPLFDELIREKYIDTTIEVFNHAMEYKRLPVGADKIQWLKFASEGVYFNTV
jgi:hypothetical protein